MYSDEINYSVVTVFANPLGMSGFRLESVAIFDVMICIGTMASAGVSAPILGIRISTSAKSTSSSKSVMTIMYPPLALICIVELIVISLSSEVIMLIVGVVSSSLIIA